jgi:hypothetical protein
MELKVYSQLPDDLLYHICCLTGKFRIYYNYKTNKSELSNIIDLTQQKWVDFNQNFSQCVNKKRRRMNLSNHIPSNAI